MDRLLSRLEPLLGRCEGEPVALEGGVTNCNYRVCMGGIDYVVRRPGKDTRLLGIDRATEREAGRRGTSRRRGGGARIEAALGPPKRPVRCHNDLLAANFPEGDGRLWIIDWEYAGMGTPGSTSATCRSTTVSRRPTTSGC